MNNELTWMIGGPQGSGVETAANIFSQVYSKMGYHVFGKREYYSNIKGEHSYFAVRILTTDFSPQTSDLREKQENSSRNTQHAKRKT